MDAIEKAIRNAFEKGDPSERAFREKVYRSAFSALDRTLAANPNVTEAIAQRRREMLSAQISEIESEFLPAAPAVEPALATRQAEPAAPAAPEPVVQSRDEPAFEPVVTPRDRGGYAPQTDDYNDDIDPPSYEDHAHRPRGRRWIRPLIPFAILAVVVVGAWLVWGSGPISRPASPPPPQTAEDPPAGPPAVGGADGLEGWIAIFDPSDPTTVTAPGDSRAEVMEEDGQSFMRIGSGSSGSPVLFDVGQGVLERLAGRRAVFAILAQAQEGQETQISVECSLAELGDCGRKRYAVGVTREEFLFEITLPAARPGSGGTIAIRPDIENGGRSVDIHAIRVAPAR